MLCKECAANQTDLGAQGAQGSTLEPVPKSKVQHTWKCSECKDIHSKANNRMWLYFKFLSLQMLLFSVTPLQLQNLLKHFPLQLYTNSGFPHCNCSLIQGSTTKQPDAKSLSARTTIFKLLTGCCCL